MRAMIFAGGIGSRLKPFTLSHPKALVQVGGVTMLERVILKLKEYGVTYIVVNVHHFSQQIIDFLKANDNFGVDIRISDESDLLLDTGGGLLKARALFKGEDPIIVHNVDILTDFDLSKMIKAHLSNQPLATLFVSKRKTDRLLLLDQKMRMHGWLRESTKETKPNDLEMDGLEKWAFGGVHIVSPQIFSLLNDYKQKTGSDESFSIMSFYISQCQNRSASEYPEQCQEQCIYGYCPEENFSWHDIGKPETLKAAELDIDRGLENRAKQSHN